MEFLKLGPPLLWSVFSWSFDIRVWWGCWGVVNDGVWAAFFGFSMDFQVGFWTMTRGVLLTGFTDCFRDSFIRGVVLRC